MSRRRRALLLAGLAILLGSLAASDVAGREARLRRALEPLVPVLVAREQLAAGERVAARALAIRRVPARFAPAAVYSHPGEVVGMRLAVAVPAGADVGPGALEQRSDGSGTGPLRPGERVAEIVAVGSSEIVLPGARVDVIVTSEARGDGAGGRTVLALQDVEVLAVAPLTEARTDDGASRVAASLRVTLRQAVYLAAAQGFARELRLLPRAPNDRRRGGALAITASRIG